MVDFLLRRAASVSPPVSAIDGDLEWGSPAVEAEVGMGREANAWGWGNSMHAMQAASTATGGDAHPRHTNAWLAGMAPQALTTPPSLSSLSRCEAPSAAERIRAVM